VHSGRGEGVESSIAVRLVYAGLRSRKQSLVALVGVDISSVG
jgi:hypothetical protein